MTVDFHSKKRNGSVQALIVPLHLKLIGLMFEFLISTAYTLQQVFTHADDSLGVGRVFGCVCVYVCVCVFVCLSVCIVEKKPLEVLTSNLTSC